MSAVSESEGMVACPACGCTHHAVGSQHPVATLLIMGDGRLELTMNQRHISVGPGSGVRLSGDTATAALATHAFLPEDIAPADADATAARRAQVLSHIAAHHGDPELSVGTLAAGLGLSTRSLQRLFAGERRSVAEEIAAVRLSRALELLGDPELRDVPLEDIAAQSGFGAVARMRRAIRSATGMSPRDYRAPRR